MKTTASIAAICLVFLFSCKKWIDPALVQSDYPSAIENIMVNKCAVSGCHNNQSYQNAGGLNLTTYNNLLNGAVNGAVVVPYSTTHSSLLQFINTHADLGLIATPTMPLNADPLSREEVITVKNWIAAGCPDDEGSIPFASNADTRAKIYISNQGCDIVSVVDAETQLVMRYVKVGHDDNVTEVPHCIRVSEDKKYWFVCFNSGGYLQQFDAATDRLSAEYNLGSGFWNILKVTPDSKRVIVSDFSDNGKIYDVNILTGEIKKYAGDGLFASPHGIATSRSGDTMYITAQNGNMIYRFIPSLFSKISVSLQKGQPPVTTPGLLDPHEILMSPDYSKYFITCQASNEVRVMNAKTDTLLYTIPVGIKPLEMAISKSKNLLFVTCQEDINPNAKSKGSVYVIDINTMNVIKIIKEKFYQPHGIALDQARNFLYVVSRNIEANGPAPHHTSACGGRNGFFQVIDINSWQLVRTSSEISVDPYSADAR